MRNKELVLEILGQIEEALEKILTRFQPIKQANDFTNSPSGMEKMDAICMQLIVIGESLKNLDKITEASLLTQYPEVDWKKAKGMRDILSHHYADINVEAVFNTCKEKIPQLKKTIRAILDDISE
jgi:uncharacterized protein with HEPN domain